MENILFTFMATIMSNEVALIFARWSFVGLCVRSLRCLALSTYSEAVAERVEFPS